MGMPLDAIFVYYVYTDRSRFLLYVLLGSAGSALGSIVLYVIGYTGGEMLLRKRLSAERFEKIHASFDRHEFWALMFPAMLPPPAPFKIVVPVSYTHLDVYKRQVYDLLVLRGSAHPRYIQGIGFSSFATFLPLWRQC